MGQQQAIRPDTRQDIVDDDDDDDDGDDDDHNGYVRFPFSAYDYPICIHDYL